MPSSYSNFKKTSRKLVVKSGETGIIIASDKGMAPQESPTPRDPAQRERTPMDTRKSSAPYAQPSTDDQDDTLEAHYACLERPHACMDGWVFLGRVVESEHDLDGEVVEYERVPCRRCAEEASL
jgi:hypothetical protein